MSSTQVRQGRTSPANPESCVLAPASLTPLILPPRVAAELVRLVNEGVRAVPRGGAEIGGLLVANREGPLVVDRLVPIEISYCFGPTFRLSEDDLASLEEAVRSVETSANSTVIGFYRSWTRGDTRLRPDDRAILAAIERAHQSYAAGFRFFVILSQLSKLAVSAEAAEVKGKDFGEWQKTMVLVSGIPAGAITAASPEPVPSLQLAENEPAVPARVTEAVPDQAPAPPIGWRTILIYTGLLLVLGVGATGAYFGLESRRPVPVAPVAPPAASARVGFAAAPEGSLWKLTWNRDAVAALDPQDAVLTIADGGNQQTIPLTRADLATGMAFYTAQSGDLLFGLTLQRSGADPLRESVRVLRGPAPPHAATPAVQIPVAGNTLRTLRPFVPPAAPRVEQTGGENFEPAPALTASARADLPAAVVNSAPVVVVPPPKPAAPAPAPSLPKPDDYAGPKTVREVQARVPDGVSFAPGSVVRIQVAIDAMGKVRNATPAGGTVTDFRAIEEALAAARAWQFEPARRNGVPVDSEETLVFHFGK